MAVGRPEELSLQERFAPRLVCFGCGPANPAGLRLRSFPRADGAGATFHAAPHHEAFPGMLNGGIAGTIFDCHMLWTGAWALMRARGLAAPPPMVTAEYSVRFRRPIPTAGAIELSARAVDLADDRATVEASLVAGGVERATARGVFVAVKEGHPAFHRW